MTDPVEHVERIEAVDIHPGDTIVVYLQEMPPSYGDLDAFLSQMKHIWPDNEVVFLGGIDHIEIQRPGGDDGDALGTVDAEEPGAQGPPQGEDPGRAAP